MTKLIFVLFKGTVTNQMYFHLLILNNHRLEGPQHRVQPLQDLHQFQGQHHTLSVTNQMYFQLLILNNHRLEGPQHRVQPLQDLHQFQGQ